jgi:hypothetical protein
LSKPAIWVCLAPVVSGAFTVLAALVAAGGLATAQVGQSLQQEYRIKAALLWNIAKFVEWPAPEEPKAPLVVVVFGTSWYGLDLANALWGRTVNDRPIQVRNTNRLDKLLPCHILFIGGSDRRRLPEVLKAVDGSAILTVGEVEDFLELGGAIRILTEGDRMRFAVNLEAARRNQLRISAKLLSLAKSVRN